MTLDLQQRSNRLDRIVGPLLVRKIPLPLQYIHRLRIAAYNCLWPSAGKRAQIEDMQAELLAADNRTPNGVMKPRPAFQEWFNRLDECVAEMLDEMGLTFAAVQMPVNLRVVEGQHDPIAEARPYASTKKHTDLWNGEPLSAVLFNIPVLGDCEAVNLKFFQPKEFPTAYVRSMDDYDVGADLESHELPVKFEMGYAYISDALALHQTVKSGSGIRCSIDFRCIAAELLPGETAEASESKAHYRAVDARA